MLGGMAGVFGLAYREAAVDVMWPAVENHEWRLTVIGFQHLGGETAYWNS